MSELHDIAFAKAGLWQLALLGCVACIAYAARDRRVALFGGFGLFLGFVIPRRRVYANFSSVEGAFIGALNDIADHLVFWAFVGAAVGSCVGLWLALRQKSRAIASNVPLNPSVPQ